jgi:thiol-disulfide isomerase/thioredoxin
MQNVKLAVVALAALAIVGAFGLRAWRERGAGALRAEHAFRIERSQAPAPPATFQKEDGTPVRLAELFPGEVLFVNFWATWCPPCRDEMPTMLELGRELGAKYPGKFRMVAASVDEGWPEIREFFGGKLPPEAVFLLDPEQDATRAFYCGARGACPDSFKFPETYVIDKRGRIAAYIVGPRDWSEAAPRKLVERLVRE